MDIESDDSERWEDFFGSSTDLTSSLLCIYDTLTSNLEIGNGNGNGSNNGNSTANGIDSGNDKDNSNSNSNINNSNINNNGINTITTYIHGDNSCETSLNEEDNFYKDAADNDDTASDQLKCISKCNQTSDIHMINLTKKTAATFNRCKASLENVLTGPVVNSLNSLNGNDNCNQLRNNNICILSAKVKHIITHTDIQPVNILHNQTIINSNVIKKLQNICNINNHNNKQFNSTDVVSTNANISVSKLPIIQAITNDDKGIVICETSKLQITPKNEKILLVNISRTIADDNRTNDNIKITSCLPTLCEDVQTDHINNIVNEVKTKLIEINVSNDIGRDVLHDKKFITSPLTDDISNEKIVSYPCKKEAPLQKVNEKYTSSNSCYTSHNNVEVLSKTLNNSNQFITGVNQLKFMPKESSKISNIFLTEISKLKNRPLSSLSLCSTTSSSSSGSGIDHLNCKHNTSYLASVESLADQSENELMEPHTDMSVFERACLEILDSEKAYVNDLGEVIRGYLADWKERACLTYNDLKILFANIEDVYEFNTALMKRLQNSALDPIKIANCFLEMKSGFDVYTTYCTSYPDAIQLLTKLLQATHTNALLTSTQKMLQHNLPLGSYLLKPVQRILKYHLLLDNLRKHCDIKEVMQAYEIMRQVARNIDQVKRKLEQQTRVKELSGILDGWLGPELMVLGELRLEGVLMEHNKPRRVLLFSTMLIIAKAKEDQRLQFKSYIHQNNLMLSEHLSGEPTSFFVIPYDEPRNQIKLTAKNRDQKRLWTQQIKSVLLEKFENIPLRAKELVYQLGDEEDHSTDKTPWKWSLHSASTLTYLERRNQYRRSDIRNRSKVKRKTISNPNSTLETTKSGKTINAFKSISKSAESIHEQINENNGEEDVSDFSREYCQHCKEIKIRENQSSNYCNKCTLRSGRKASTSSEKILKERSKSVPRISSTNEQFGSQIEQSSADNSPKGKGRKFLNSTSTCNQKTLQKRFTSLRKQKFSKKENSTFYMTLSEFEEATNNTILKITESSENVSTPNYTDEIEIEKASNPLSIQLPDVIERQNNIPTDFSHLSAREKARQDAQIVLDLLKNSKEFDKFYSKLQKKRSTEKSVSPVGSTSSNNVREIDLRELPPRPPSKSPPPLEIENIESICGDTEREITEPIYETLRRNVHVPYKFSPVLSRSKSVIYCKSTSRKPEPIPRPESDYVTLVYSSDNVLQNIDHEPVKASLKKDQETSKQKTQDSLHATVPNNVSENNLHATTETNHLRPLSKNLLKRLLSSSTVNSEDAPAKTTTQSDCDTRYSVLHLQGSEAVGERIAHIDYADPRTLFSVIKPKVDALTIVQRDSAFSLTSSNDSVYDQKCHTVDKCVEFLNDFEYENCVEACLENEYRDSAVYSDDTERRLCTTSSHKINTPPQIKPKPINVPSKPNLVTQTKPIMSQYLQSLPEKCFATPHLVSGSTSSWVLQQIQNFNK